MGLDSFERISSHLERQHFLWQESPLDSAFDPEADTETSLASEC